MKTPNIKPHNNSVLGPCRILAAIGSGATVVTCKKSQSIFAQGDADTTVFFIQEGRVRLSVTSKLGKEATLCVMSRGEFFGEGGLAGQPLRMKSATATADCKLLRIDKEAMMRALRRDRFLTDLFVRRLLARNIRYHEALVDQLFEPSDVRLAKVLLLHAQFAEQTTPETFVPNLSQLTLANRAGTSPVRVCSLMKKFKRLGFLAYSKKGLQIHASLLNMVLQN